MDEQAPGLRDVFRILWRNRLLIGLIVAVTTIGAFGYSITQPKTYTASSRVLIQDVLSPAVLSSLGGSRGGSRSGALGDLSTETQSKIVESSVVANRVIDALKITTPPQKLLKLIKVRVLGDSLLAIDASAGTPQAAAALSDSFAQQYLEYRKELATGEIGRVIQALTQSAAENRKRIDELDQRIITLSERIAVLSPPSPAVLTSGQAREKARLQEESVRLSSERAGLLDRLSDEESRARTLELTKISSSGEVVQQAAVPVKPSRPKPFIDAILGLVIGSIIGVTVAFARHHFDSRIRTRDAAARASGAAVVGAIPQIESWRGARSPDLLVSVCDPASRAAEGYRTLRANLAAQGLGTRIRFLLVTSSGRGEGKSTTVANLAVACANAGLRTLAISADPRRPRLHTYFSVPSSPGIAEVLRGTAPLAIAIFPTDVPNLFVLPSDADVAGGSDVLASPRLHEILIEAAAHADLVLIDAAAVSDGADAAILARAAGASLLVIEADAAERAAVSRAGAVLTQAGSQLIGAVLNQADPTDESTGVEPRRSGSLVPYPNTNGHGKDRVTDVPLQLSRPVGEGFGGPRTLPPPPQHRASRTWEVEDE